jgi:hypothetical protein
MTNSHESSKRDNVPTVGESQVCATETARREFLQKCGKFAAYTAPVVAALLLCDTKTGQASSAP